MLTDKDILQYFRSALIASPLAGALSGDIYLRGTRPRDSKAEDAVLSFVAGIPGEIETGVVCINIYVADIDPDDNGTSIEDFERTSELEAIAAQWADDMEADASEYLVRLYEPVHVSEAQENRQHFIVVKFKYQNLNED